jgi:lipopolysaccharide export system protein LptA
LTSKYGYFHPNTEESFFRGNVVYKSPEVKMTTDTLQYNYLLHRVYFYGPTNVTNKETKLYCEKGWYNVETEEGVLRSNAWIDQETKRIEGDSLYYAPLKKIGIAKGNVKIFEKKENLELRAGYVHSDELKGLDVLTENPVVIWKRTKDTLFVRADTLKHFRDTLNKTTRLIGNREIKLYQNDIQAIADSLDYQKDKGEMKLWSNAHFWSKNSELTGDTISVYFLQDTLLDRVFLRNNAFAANEVDSSRFYNQLAGKEMWAYFKDKELIKSTVNGNAETLFYPIQKEETDSTIIEKRLGMNRLIASQLKVILDSGEVKGVTFIEQPEGIFYPIDQLVEELKFLKSFKWNPALRPKTYKELIKSEL